LHLFGTRITPRSSEKKEKEKKVDPFVLMLERKEKSSIYSLLSNRQFERI
jgi:hypothetical protein